MSWQFEGSTAGSVLDFLHCNKRNLIVRKMTDNCEKKDMKLQPVKMGSIFIYGRFWMPSAEIQLCGWLYNKGLDLHERPVNAEIQTL